MADEVCRFCGSEEVHTRTYGQPTQQCVDYLRGLSYERDRLVEAVDEFLKAVSDSCRQRQLSDRLRELDAGITKLREARDKID
jgi:hypothetical protein